MFRLQRIKLCRRRPGQTLPAPSSPTIVVPIGTAIQLHFLMSAVKSKSTKAGDTVRAVVAFPVTIGTELAIPAGTFVDGNVIRVTAHPAGEPEDIVPGPLYSPGVFQWLLGYVEWREHPSVASARREQRARK